jgi:hypothetical protein
MIGKSHAETESEELSKREAEEAHAGLRDTIEELREENAQLERALDKVIRNNPWCPPGHKDCIEGLPETISEQCYQCIRKWAME